MLYSQADKPSGEPDQLRAPVQPVEVDVSGAAAIPEFVLQTGPQEPDRHTGQVWVGNVGTSDRLSYTALSGVVNPRIAH